MMSKDQPKDIHLLTTPEGNEALKRIQLCFGYSTKKEALSDMIHFFDSTGQNPRAEHIDNTISAIASLEKKIIPAIRSVDNRFVSFFKNQEKNILAPAIEEVRIGNQANSEMLVHIQNNLSAIAKGINILASSNK